MNPHKLFPFLAWFEGYDFSKLRIDLVAGLTVALVLIPQSMAYAQLAGLPAYYGLYASLAPPMIAALFGSCRRLHTGPVAVVSLMTAASLQPLATLGSEAFLAYAVLLALIVGTFQLILGVLRLGLVVNFLSHPVVNGFTNGAALIIATSQLSKLFGVHVDAAEHHYETIARVLVAAYNHIHWPTFGFGVGSFALMYALKRLNPRIPNVLVAVVLTVFISWLIGFKQEERVDIEALDSSEARALLLEFNDAVGEIERYGQERAHLGEALHAAGSEPKMKVLELRHQRDISELRLAQASERTARARTQLRNLSLAKLVGGVASGKFVPIFEVGGAETDGRTYRISVERGSIDLDGVRLIAGGEVVGTIPEGLPAFSVPRLELSAIFSLFPYAVIIALLGFMEAISIAKAMAAKTGLRLDPSQELIGQGLGNIAGAFTQSAPVSGSFSRSAVNFQAGAVTGLSSVFTSLIVMVVLLFLTPLLYFLPQAVLAAVIMMAVIGLLNIHGFIHAWRAQWYDGVILLITFAATLAFAPHLDRGIMIGVGLSLMVFLYKSMRPKVAALSMHEHVLHDAERFGLKQCHRLVVIRFGGPLFFANASFLEDQISDRIESMPQLREILIVASGINEMDASGDEKLSLLVDRVRAAGYGISFCEINENVMDVLERTYHLQKIGKNNIYPTLSEAIEAIHPRAHDDHTCCLLSDEGGTPEEVVTCR